jgi:hypothetical protein
MQPMPMDLSKLSPIKPDPDLSAMNHPVTDLEREMRLDV